MKKAAFAVLLFLAVLTPSLAFAAAGLEGPIVPACEGAACRLCDLKTLADNIISFAALFSVFVATVMFAYGGILYVTASSAEANIKKAHGVLLNTLIGIIIVLIAWLIVNIVLSVLTGGSITDWTSVRCVANPTSGPFSAASALDSGGNRFGYFTAGGNCSAVQSGPATAQNLGSTFGAGAQNMSVVAQGESGGNPLKCGDQMWYEPKGTFMSCGLFQVNLTQNPISCPNGTSLNCPSAFGPTPGKDPGEARYLTLGGKSVRTTATGGGWGKTIINQDLYHQCVQLAQNPTCNIYTAKNILQQHPDYSSWPYTRDRCLL